jgi:hypothetical protein
VGSAFDSVTFAAMFDAITQPGPAEASRLPNNVCSSPYAKGLKPIRMQAELRLVGDAAKVHLMDQPLVRAEPKVKKYFKH